MSPRRGKENDRPGPPVSDEGGVRQPKGRTNEQAGGASAGSCGRDADCVKARDLVRPHEAGPLRERAKGEKAGGPRQSARSVCLPMARSSASCLRGRAERPLVLRSRSRPHRPGTGSLSIAKSAGTGQQEITACRRDGPVAAQRSSGASRRQRRACAGPRSGRVQAKRGRTGYGAATTTKAGGPRRSRCEARVRRRPGGPWGSPLGADGSRRGSLAAAARSAAPQADAAAGAGGGRLAGRLPRVTGHGCTAGHVLCEAMQAA